VTARRGLLNAVKLIRHPLALPRRGRIRGILGLHFKLADLVISGGLDQCSNNYLQSLTTTKPLQGPLFHRACHPSRARSLVPRAASWYIHNRYTTDEEYKQKILQQKKEYYQRKRLEQLEKEKIENPAKYLEREKRRLKKLEASESIQSKQHLFLY
jgi:hypothetical protein